MYLKKKNVPENLSIKLSSAMPKMQLGILNSAFSNTKVVSVYQKKSYKSVKKINQIVCFEIYNKNNYKII